MKQKSSKKTKKIIAKNFSGGVQSVSAKEIVKEEKKIEIEDRLIKKFNILIYIFGIIGLIVAIFQVVKIFAFQTVAGISPTHLIAYLIVAAGWFAYGYSYKNKAIMTVYGFWMTIEIVILNGIYFS